MASMKKKGGSNSPAPKPPKPKSDGKMTILPYPLPSQAGKKKPGK